MSDSGSNRVLAAAVPPNVRQVCAVLTDAGHQAVTVGGAVRDVLLGRTPGDWDVASSARPEELLVLFRHTIPTGLAHGTVTVVTGKGAQSHVEVTTFRGEGGYSDGRRPDQVRFGVSLVEDLARRDLVVNAIAYDPANDRIVDPFDGQGDIKRKTLRAVGDAVARFTEDGLRVMRAVRLAAQLEFALDPATEAAIAPALPSLAKVSRERVSDELRKLLGARQPSHGLEIARRTGILRGILPDLDEVITDVEVGRWLGRIDRAPVELRLAALFVPVARRDDIVHLAKMLKFSNGEAQLAGALASAMPRGEPPTAAGVRKQFAALGREMSRQLLVLWSLEQPPLPHRAIGERVIDDPFAVKDLAVAGADLMRALHLSPGPVIGRLLNRLHECVLDDPTLNTPEQLLALAAEFRPEVVD